MKRLILLLIISFASICVQAQSSTSDDPMNKFYFVMGFTFVVLLLVLFSLVYLLKVVRVLAEKAARDKAEKSGLAYQPEPSLLQQFWARINGFVPPEKEATLVLDHDYDGIKELDNHLPPWWKLLFYASIIWGIGYLLVYHAFNSLPLSTAEYENEVALAATQSQQSANKGPQIDETNVEATTDATLLENGKSTFLNTCSSCHRRDGGGDIGPNLTDQFWKHGGSVKNIFHVVTNGVPGTNMVAWGSSMSPVAIRNVVSYVLTLQGSNPVNPKKQEGELYKPEVKTPKADTVKTQSP